MSEFLKIFAVFTMLAALVGCGQNPRSTEDGAPSVFQMKLGSKSFEAEIALTESEKMTGLMFRQTLEADRAMIFVYESPIRASFWMKNTSIPLDIGFFDAEGKLTEIRKLYPFNLDSVRSASADILYCMETNAGWYVANNISVGDTLDMKMLNSAIKAKGSR